jgi:DNA-binding CsgD family transcriptional regulator
MVRGVMGTLHAMAEGMGFTPMERRMVRLANGGLDTDEIARRFRRSPGFVERVLTLARVPRRGDGRRAAGGLRPVERRVLKWREGGASASDIAPRFRRNARTIEQIERLARYKQSSS